MSETPRSVQFCRSLPTGRDRLQVRRSGYATEKLVRHMRRSSAGHSQLVVTGLKSAVLDMPRKSWYALCCAVPPGISQSAYLTGFVSVI